MRASFIVDCSIAMAWCFEDEATERTDAILARLSTESFLVPEHWFLEVANVLAMAEKRKRISQAKVDEFLSLLSVFDIEVDTGLSKRAFAQLPSLCRKYALTSYDAAYLELAVLRQLPLASLDSDLCMAAEKAGVVII